MSLNDWLFLLFFIGSFICFFIAVERKYKKYQENANVAFFYERQTIELLRDIKNLLKGEPSLFN